ncbi:hypothetical protein NM688_g3454 [Phlebia brevispora]|uniref:Uncharacterized protein n=1 Tax=Phlebia brevispora TaxID=194682 RepID=A0ACC1T5U9_9APHY|nr:hypothetical protein NM688_g3454 [Phlebia brevispora]
MSTRAPDRVSASTRRSRRGQQAKHLDLGAHLAAKDRSTSATTYTMGKLNIAHHKSYHPYRRDNIERVRRDEEEARLNEAAKEGKMMLADAEARIELLRKRVGLPSQSTSNAEEHDTLVETRPSSLTSGGHINLFEDLERKTLQVAGKPAKNSPALTEQGIPLAPSEKDRKPWYSDRDHEKNRGIDGDRRTRELARQSAQDPLTSINRQLSRRTADSESSRPKATTRLPPPAPYNSRPEVSERLTRESSERQRALELIKRKRRQLEGSETPSTVHGGYGDVFNRREVEEAHRNRDRRRHGDEHSWRSGRRW